MASSLVNTLQTVFDYGQALSNTYTILQRTISNTTGGAISLPGIPSQLASFLGSISTVPGVGTYSVAGGQGNYGQRISDPSQIIQVSTMNAQSGLNKWVQMYVSPDDFASPDSCIIGIGAPILSSMKPGSALGLLGMCMGASFSTGVNVVSVKDLRCETNYIIPTKSQAGSLNLTRLLGNYKNINNLVNGGSEYNWNFDASSAPSKNLFGVLMIFLTYRRTQGLGAVYFERCALQNMSASIQANSLQVAESVSIMYDRAVSLDSQGNMSIMGNIPLSLNGEVINGSMVSPTGPDLPQANTNLASNYSLNPLGYGSGYTVKDPSISVKIPGNGIDLWQIK